MQDMKMMDQFAEQVATLTAAKNHGNNTRQF